MGNWSMDKHLNGECITIGRSTHTEFFALCRWIMLSACHPDPDASCKLKAALTSYFDLSSIEQLPAGLIPQVVTLGYLIRPYQSTLGA